MLSETGFPLGDFFRAKRIFSPRKNSSKRVCIFHNTSDYLDQLSFERLFGSKFNLKMAAALSLINIFTLAKGEIG